LCALYDILSKILLEKSCFFSGRTEYQTTLEEIIPRRHVHFERRPSHRYAQRTQKTTKIKWATPTTTIVDEESLTLSATSPKALKSGKIGCKERIKYE